MKRKQPQAVRLPNGRDLVCTVCGYGYFNKAYYKLNTSGMELFNLAWANRDATCLICASCGFIHWFRF